MMKRIVLFFMTCLFVCSAFAQDGGRKEKLYAKSFLNQKAPEFVVEKWLTGVPEMKGKMILIDFWGPSCAPCREGIPALNEFSKRYKDELVVIGLSSSKEERVRAMKEPVIEFFSAIDTKRRMSKELKITGVPHVILIDTKGIVRWQGIRLTEDVLKSLLWRYSLKGTPLLGEKAPELVVEKWLTKKPKTKGKFVLIDFWGPSCKPCVKGIPELNRLSKEFKKEMVVIGLAPNKEDFVRAMKEPVIEYYSAIDTRRKAPAMSRVLKLRASPYALLIDPDGVVRWEGNPGTDELNSETIRGIIETYKSRK